MDDIEDADFYLVGEHHEDLRVINQNGNLISELSNQSAWFLCESIRFDEARPEWKKAALIGLSLPEAYSAREMYLTGWDIGYEEFPEYIELIRKIDETQSELIEANRQIEAAEAAFEQILTHLGLERSNYRDSERFSTFSDLEHSNLYELNKDELKAHQLFSKKMDEMHRLLEEQGLFIQATFPQRTQSMIETLRLVAARRNATNFQGKVILIAGANHLRVAESDIGKQNFELNSLYEELRNHKAVILMPKACGN